MHSLDFTLENRPFSSGSELELNVRDSNRAHNQTLISSPPPLLSFSPMTQFKRSGFKIPIFPVTVGNYLNNTKSPECAVQTLVITRSSVVGCISSVIKFRGKAFRNISFFFPPQSCLFGMGAHGNSHQQQQVLNRGFSPLNAASAAQGRCFFPSGFPTSRE